MSAEAPSGYKSKQEGSRLDIKNFLACVSMRGIPAKTVDPFPELVRHQQLPEKSVVVEGGNQGTEIPMSLVEVQVDGVSACWHSG